jgi:hypothetical protein
MAPSSAKDEVMRSSRTRGVDPIASDAEARTLRMGKGNDATIAEGTVRSQSQMVLAVASVSCGA